MIQLPKCTTKNGFHKTEKKIYTDFLFDEEEDSFPEWIDTLSDVIKNLIYEKKEIWFQDDLSLDDIEYAWQDSLRKYKRKFHLFRCFVKKPRNISFNNLIMIYDEDGNNLTLDDVKPENQVIPLVQLSGLKFTTHSFSLQFNLKQLMVIKNIKVQTKRLISLQNETVSEVPTRQNVSTIVDNESEIKDKETTQELSSDKKELFSNNNVNNINNVNNDNNDNNDNVKLSILEVQDLGKNLIDNKETLEKSNLNNELSNSIQSAPEKSLESLNENDKNTNLEVKTLDSSTNNLNDPNLNLNKESSENNNNNSDDEEMDTNKDSSQTETESDNLNEDTNELTNEQNNKETTQIMEDETYNLTKSDTLKDLGLNEIIIEPTLEGEPIKLRNPNEVYIEIYQEARRRAKEAKKMAIEAFLEAKRIKNKYMLDEIESSDDDLEYMIEQ